MRFDRTVVVLGAGASAASDHHLPVMARFFDPTDKNLSKEMLDFLNWYSAGSGLENVNLEDALTYLALSDRYLQNWSAARGRRSEHRLGVSHRDFVGYVAKRLETPGTVCSKHSQLFQSLNEADTVVTLNYDLVADIALEATDESNAESFPQGITRPQKMASLVGELNLIGQTPPGLLSWEEETGFYLKLHGAIDWVYCPNSICRNNSRYWSTENDKQSRRGMSFGTGCRLCGTVLDAFIVAPSPEKGIVPASRLGLLWKMALNEITNARKLVIIGFSFAPSDFELQWLFRQAAEFRRRMMGEWPEVVVVNPDPEHRIRAGHLLSVRGSSPGFEEFDSLDDYLATL